MSRAFSVSFLALSLMFGMQSSFGQGDMAIVKTLHVAGDGRWDYLTLSPANENLYVSHGTQVNVINRNTGAPVATIPNTMGVHGIAIAASCNKGYISNGKSGTVTVFDLATNKEITQIRTGDNPDAIMYEQETKQIIVCNGKSSSLSIIDPSTDRVVKTVALGGKPETAVAGEHRLYVNIEDKNEVVVLDLGKMEILHRWKTGHGEEPSGLAIDPKTHHLFAGCGNKLLVVMDAGNGNVIKEVGIGNGSDGIVFDPATNNIFSSNGEGTISVVRADKNGSYELASTITTKKGARTIAIDEHTHLLYLPTAELNPAVAGQRPEPVPNTFQVLVVGKR